MKISKVNIPKNISETYGLKPVSMEKLGSVVVIAGKNGAGKTRLLNLIKFRFSIYPNNEQIKPIKTLLNSSFLRIEEYENQVVQLEERLKITTLETIREEININIQNHISAITQEEHQIANYNNILGTLKEIELTSNKTSNDILDFVPKNLSLSDSYNMSYSQQENQKNNAYQLGITYIADSALPLIETVIRDWVNINSNATEGLVITEEDKTEANSNYSRLKNYIKLLLNTELERDKKGNPLIYKKRFAEAGLSDGQKILLQFCVMLFAQDKKLEDLILMMDEPENHLHPSLVLEVIDKIITHIPKGQIWIATHSLNILAHFDPSSIFYIEDGNVSYAGNIPEKVLNGLLGNEDEIHRLSSFLNLPSQIASDKFAFESLFYPDVVFTDNKDHQVAQINKIIKERITHNNKLEVLDFGIGKARLLAAIYENDRIEGIETKDWLNFYGFDADPGNKLQCDIVFETVYGNSLNKYFNNENQLLMNIEEGKLDFIVMCNVFHEIDPAKWLSLFTSKKSIFNLLKKDGHVLIVEDQFLAIGEKAHSKGFIVFDSLEFKALFNMRGEEYKSSDHRSDGRLKAHFIPKECLTRIDINSVIKALEILKENATEQIQNIREVKQPKFKHGKLHSFWAQQLANAHMALKDIKSA